MTSETFFNLIQLICAKFTLWLPFISDALQKLIKKNSDQEYTAKFVIFPEMIWFSVMQNGRISIMFAANLRCSIFWVPMHKFREYMKIQSNVFHAYIYSKWLLLDASANRYILTFLSTCFANVLLIYIIKTVSNRMYEKRS